MKHSHSLTISDIYFTSVENTVLYKKKNNSPYIKGFAVKVCCLLNDVERKLLFRTRDENLTTLKLVADSDVNLKESCAILLAIGIDCLKCGGLPQTLLQGLLLSSGLVKSLILDAFTCFDHHAKRGYKDARYILLDSNSTSEERKWAEELMEASAKLAEALEASWPSVEKMDCPDIDAHHLDYEMSAFISSQY